MMSWSVPAPLTISRESFLAGVEGAIENLGESPFLSALGTTQVMWSYRVMITNELALWPFRAGQKHWFDHCLQWLCALDCFFSVTEIWPWTFGCGVCLAWLLVTLLMGICNAFDFMGVHLWRVVESNFWHTRRLLTNRLTKLLANFEHGFPFPYLPGFAKRFSSCLPEFETCSSPFRSWSTLLTSDIRDLLDSHGKLVQTSLLLVQYDA